LFAIFGENGLGWQGAGWVTLRRFRYRDEAVKEHIIAWAEANQMTVEDDTPTRSRNGP
jgi:hypothetical protein